MWRVYSCLLVGLICVFMPKIFSWNLLPLYRVMSRNVSLLWLISCVVLI